MKKFGVLTAVLLFLFLAGIVPAQAATKTWTGGTGDWFVDGNWNSGAGPMPTNGDNVVIAVAGASVLLTNSTPPLSSLTLSNTLVFSNWNTTLSATNITIQTNGVMTLPGAFTNNAMSNNVYIVCSNLTIDAGGKINVDSMGFAGGTNNGGAYAPGNGPGYGLLSAGGYGFGAGHGGFALKDVIGGQGGAFYGSTTNPVEPGSGGCSGYSGSAGNHNGGHGGGAVRIEAGAAVILNGTITANGGTAGSVYVTGGGGSGGSILMRCRTLAGSSGIIQANGGNGGDANGGGGAGGRIAVFYDISAQHALPSMPPLQITTLPGTTGRAADIGSVYFSDGYFLTETLTTNLAGQLWGFTSWAPTNLVVTNTWIRFAEDGFRLAVTNDVKVFGSGGKLELGGSITWNRYMYSINSDTSGPTLTVGGSLILTNGGSLYMYAGMTNAAAPSYGALVAVTNELVIATNSWIYPVSHPTNGGSVRFTARKLTIATNAGFNANYKGFSGGSGYGVAGYGPGKGPAAGGNFSSGAGYGGNGGIGAGTSAGGTTYGSAQLPLGPGSGGGAGNYAGGWGGGVVWIEVTEDVLMNGSLTANGETPSWYVNGGGSGGGIYVTCRSIAGTNGTISAIGGYAPNVNDGAGGGGRIALNYNTSAQSALPVPSITFSCAPGQLGYTVYSKDADIGTVWLPDNRFLTETMSHSAQLIVSGATSWSPNRLCISNGWIRFPFDAFTLTVTNDLTVVGTSVTLNKLEASRINCMTIGITNAALIIKGLSSAPSLTSAGNITATNGNLICDANSTTGASFTCGGNLALQNGSSFYIYIGLTNSMSPNYGALVTVAGDLTITNAWIYLYSNPTNGGSALFRMRNLTIYSTNGGFNANAAGFQVNYGPGAGLNYGGGGYGGLGGDTGGGQTYGSSNAPLAVGSGSGIGNGNGGRGGGSVRLEVAQTFLHNGSVLANGQDKATTYGNGGSGGGVYITCRNFSGTSGVIYAKGGNGNTSVGAYHGGGGGGGRIAVWSINNLFTGSLTAPAGGVEANGYNGAVGTLVLGKLPAPGAIITIY